MQAASKIHPPLVGPLENHAAGELPRALPNKNWYEPPNATLEQAHHIDLSRGGQRNGSESARLGCWRAERSALAHGDLGGLQELSTPRVARPENVHDGPRGTFHHGHGLHPLGVERFALR